MTLGSGYVNKRSGEDQALIDEFYARGGKKIVYQPANVAESETVRATNEHITKKRKEFREKQRGKRTNFRDEN